MAKRIIEARVKQKKDTLANWNANPLILEDGEQAFVVREDGSGLNFKIGDGTKRFSDLPWFTIVVNGESLVVVDTIEDMRNLPNEIIEQLETGLLKGVQVNGYYAKGDTPAPIIYYLSDTAEEEDGGSVFEVGDIKLEHKFNQENISILYWGIVNDKEIDQSDKLDSHAKYCDNNGIYEIDYLNYHLMASQTVSRITPRGSHITGIAFREVHEIKNLNVYINKNKTAYQGESLIVHLVSEYPSKSQVFKLTNVTFDAYNPDYEIVSGEGDGMFGGFYTVLDGELAHTQPLIVSNISYHFKDIFFKSPALSRNISTAAILAEEIIFDGMEGEFIALYTHCFGVKSLYKNINTTYRNDLHDPSRTLVASCIHLEPEVGSNTVNISEIIISNGETKDSRGGNRRGLLFKNHNVGTINCNRVRFENIHNCQTRWAGEDSIIESLEFENCSNITVSFGVNVDSQIYKSCEDFTFWDVNGGTFRDGKIYNNVSFIDSKITSSIAYNVHVFTINELNILNTIVDTGSAIEGLINSPGQNASIKNLNIRDSIVKGKTFMRASIESVNISNVLHDVDGWTHFIRGEFVSEEEFFKVKVDRFTSTGDVSPGNSNSLIRSIENGAKLDFKYYTNSSTTSRNVIGAKFEVNTFPPPQGDAVSRPTGLKTTQRGYTYFDTSIGRPVWWNGSSWVDVSPVATTTVKGLVNQSAKVDNVASANASTDTPSTATDVAGLVDDFNDLITKYNDLVTLTNELKSKLNAKLTADRASGQQAT